MFETWLPVAIVVVGCILLAHLYVGFVRPWLDRFFGVKAMEASKKIEAPSAISAFMSEFKTNKYKKHYVPGVFNVDVFIEEMRALYPELEFLNEVCTVHGTVKGGCTSLIKLSTAIKCVIQYNWSRHGVYDGNDRPRYKFTDNSVVTMNYIDDGAMNLSYGLEIAFSGEDGDIAYNNIAKCLQVAGVNSIDYPSQHAVVRLHRVVSSMGGYRLAPYTVECSTYNREYLNKAYEPIHLPDFDKTLEAGDIIPLFADVLRMGGNIQLHGNTGSGKTRLKDFLVWYVNDTMDDVTVITLTSNTVRELCNGNAIDSFVTYLKGTVLADDNARCIFVIDEAEDLLLQKEVHTTEQQFLFDLMSGPLQTELRASVVLCYNADRKILNGKLFRRGRTAISAEVKQLTKSRALQLVSYLKGILVDKVFDAALFETLANERNLLPTGEEYASVGRISLADVYGCFQSRNIMVAIAGLISKKTGTKVTVQPSSEPTNLVARRPKVKLYDIIAPEEAKVAVKVAEPHSSNGKKRKRNRNRNRNR